MIGSLVGAAHLLLSSLWLLLSLRCKPERLRAVGGEPVWLTLAALLPWACFDWLRGGEQRWLDIWGLSTVLGGIALLAGGLALARSQLRVFDLGAVIAAVAGIAFWVGLAAVGVLFAWLPLTQYLALSDDAEAWAWQGLRAATAVWLAIVLWRLGRAASAGGRKRIGLWLVLSGLAGALVLPSRPLVNGTDSPDGTPGLLMQASDYVRSVVAPPPPRRRTPPPDVEGTFAAQPELVRRALDGLAHSRSGRPEIYFVGAATFGGEGVFRREIESAHAIVDEHLHTAGRSLAMINHRETLGQVPLATMTNLEQVLAALGRIMDHDKDVLFLYVTSHGAPGVIAEQLPGFSLNQITPQRLAHALERSGIRHKLVVLSACYSGSFVPALSSPDTVLMTAARADRTSFGCSDEREWTYFGDALFNHALRATPSPLEAFERARALVSEWEAAQKMTPSEPQISIGARAATAIAAAAAAVKAERAMKAASRDRMPAASNPPADSMPVLPTAPPPIPPPAVDGAPAEPH